MNFLYCCYEEVEESETEALGSGASGGGVARRGLRHCRCAKSLDTGGRTEAIGWGLAALWVIPGSAICGGGHGGIRLMGWCALNESDLDRRVVEGPPWLAAEYADMNWEWAVRNVKLLDRQNRLGFVAMMAARSPDKAGNAKREWRLKEYVSVLEREDTFCLESLTEAERN